VQKWKRNLEYAWGHSWRHNGCEKSKKSKTCFEGGKQGHIKSKCPIYLRKHGGEKKGKKDRKQKKAYIAWEDNASTTSNSSSDEEIANVWLMAKSMNDPSTSE